MGSHNFKAGLFFEYTTRPAARSSQFNGTFNFDRDTANPLDTEPPVRQRADRLGQQLLGGDVASRRQRASSPTSSGSSRTTGASSQNFTIDAGIRFYRIGPTQSRGDQLAVFMPGALQPGAARRLLIQPVNTPQGRRGLNPLTGEILPAVKIGTFVPNSGDPTNGIQVFDEGVLDSPAIQVAPRVGFAWDVTRRRQDGGARRLRRLPGSLQRRHHPAARRAAAAGQHADGQLHDDPRAARRRRSA